MFAALRVPNFRLYFLGQCVSLVGTWMQSVAQSWLVLELTHSATLLGLVVALQFVPVLFGGPYGGLVADRVGKRRLLQATQSGFAVLALGLGLLTVTGVVRLWVVVLFAVAFGLVNAVDNPARQSFVPELVGPEMLGNAVGLNSVVVNAARAMGPAIAGVLIATVGTGVCFLVNAASFVAVLAALALMRADRLRPVPPTHPAPGQLSEGLHYARRTPGLWIPLLMMALIGALAYEFPVILPVLAQTGLHGGAQTFGYLTSAMGAGAVLGGLAIAARGRAGATPLVIAAAGFGVALCVAATMTSLTAELIALGFVGVASTAFLAMGNTTLQLICEPQFRGRVMALWSVTFLGSTPIGGPIIGVVAQQWGPRAGLFLGAAACLAAAAAGALALPRIPAGQRLITPPAPAAGAPIAPLTEADRT